MGAEWATIAPNISNRVSQSMYGLATPNDCTGFIMYQIGHLRGVDRG
jgi:hypothetical protein